MLFEDARQAWIEFLAPATLDEFLEPVLQGAFRVLPGNASPARMRLLGDDPERLLSNAYGLAPKLSYHSANPTGPVPSLDGITDPESFRERIAAFHARNYSVRFPELRSVSPPLEQLARALEILLQQPVTTSAFWSRGGMRAPVHFDDHDLLVVQLRGAKRWYVTQRPSELPNEWKGIPSKETLELGAHHVLDLKPGDMMYLPRGTLHTVDSDTASVHVAIGFTPLTVRELLLACLDHLSDAQPGLRASIGARLGFLMRANAEERLMPAAIEAAEQLRAACRTPGFLVSALQRRSARAVAAMPMLPRGMAGTNLGLDSELEQADVAFCHLTANAEKIDLSYPGGHLYIHRGAEESVVFMVNTKRFRVRDIPGAVGDDVRLSLAARLLEIGFLKAR
ncbi:MAG: hypothetical protein JSS29_17210 [Proteobacteria bacterium]|nr:hypothetical protein [Pseudomonadota bacterium]